MIHRELRPNKDGLIDYKKSGVNINKILLNLGPTFLKLGQMLSLRADIIPPALADELRKLLDHGPAAEYAEVAKIFKEEIGEWPEDIFGHFEKKPFAVASISEVHKAIYRDKTIAVKIQRPGIRKIIQEDLAIAKMSARVLSIFSFVDKIKKAVHLLNNIIEEFFKWIEHELDYRLEAFNMTRIKNNFAESKIFVVPEIIHEYSGKRVLTMEFIEGVSLNVIFDQMGKLQKEETIQYKDIKIKKQIFIDHLVEIVFKQIFEDGYFHADPHPANIILTAKGQIAFIDFGIIGVFQPHLKESLIEIVTGLYDRDVGKITQALIKLDGVEGNYPIKVIENRIRKLLDDWQTGSVLEMSMAEVFFRLLILSQESDVEVPLAVFTLGKTILEYDGLLRKLDPEMDLFQTLKEYMEKSNFNVWQKYVPVQIKEILNNAESLVPDELAKLAEKLVQDGVKFATHLLSPKDRK